MEALWRGVEVTLSAILSTNSQVSTYALGDFKEDDDAMKKSPESTC